MERNINFITPNGYLPQIEATINDYSYAAGIKGKWNPAKFQGENVRSYFRFPISMQFE